MDGSGSPAIWIVAAIGRLLSKLGSRKRFPFHLHGCLCPVLRAVVSRPWIFDSVGGEIKDSVIVTVVRVS